MRFRVHPAVTAESTEITFRDRIEHVLPAPPGVDTEDGLVRVGFADGVAELSASTPQQFRPELEGSLIPVTDTVVALVAIESSSRFRRGDADQSGRVEIAYAVGLLQHHFLGAEELPCLDAADADDSGRLDISDALRILGYLFLGRAPPPPPGPLSSARTRRRTASTALPGSSPT